MNKLIYVDEVKKRFPIMENDFGMIVNETLHKELDKIPSVKAIPLEKVKQAREEMDKLASHKVRPISFEQAVAIDMCIKILDKLIEEVEE